MMMRSNVVLNGILGDLTDRADKIPVGPEALPPVDLLQFGKRLPNLSGGAAFDQMHDLGRSVTGLGRDQQMDMVRLDAQLLDLKFVDLSTQVNHRFQPILDLPVQHPFAILREPHKVVLNVISGVGGISDHKSIISGREGRKPAGRACGFPLRP